MAQVAGLDTGTVWRLKISAVFRRCAMPSSIVNLRNILRTPLIGRIVPEFNRQDLREVIFRGYRIVYLVQSDEVLVLRVVHGARDLLGLIRREPWDLGG